MTLLSCHRFRSNEVQLWLSLIAYNLGSLWCRLVLRHRIGNWSLTSLQQCLVNTGGRLVKHARYYWVLLAESHLTRRLFGSMLRRIAALLPPASQNQVGGGGRLSDDGRRGRRGVGVIADEKASYRFPGPGRGRTGRFIGASLEVRRPRHALLPRPGLPGER